MSRVHTAPTSERSLAPFIAQGTLGLLALVQIGLAVSAGLKFSPLTKPVLSDNSASTFSSPASLSALPLVPEMLPVFTAASAPEAPALFVKEPVKTPGKPKKPGVPFGHEIKDPRIAETVEAAREVRKMGDMQAALEALRNADLHEPNHPEILSEMALTYEAMGLADKSQAQWHRVAAMGEAGAGGYFLLARSKLDGAAPPDAPGFTNQTPEAKPIALDGCILKRDLTYTQGEKVTLRIRIKPLPGVGVHAAGINPEVYLFDQLEDGSVLQSVAAQSPARWIPSPVDWTNPQGAVVEMDFTLPHGGGRHIYGYMVKLFHDYKLMGEQAEPAQLLNFKSQSAAPAGADNALFPRN